MADVYAYLASLGYDITQSENKTGQGLPEKKKKKKELRTGHLNRLKMRMASVLKGDKYR